MSQSTRADTSGADKFISRRLIEKLRPPRKYRKARLPLDHRNAKSTTEKKTEREREFCDSCTSPEFFGDSARFLPSFASDTIERRRCDLAWLRLRDSPPPCVFQQRERFFDSMKTLVNSWQGEEAKIKANRCERGGVIDREGGANR